jgi:hypothetical protein
MSDTTGYRRPPVATRFRKGQSGNPAGRPPGRASLSKLLAEALGQRVTIRTRGRVRKVTRYEALIRTLADGAIAGDPRILRLLLGELRDADSRAAETPDDSAALGDTDRDVIASLIARLGGTP